MKNRRYLMCKLLFISVAGLSILTACKKNDNIVGTNEITTFSGVRMENKIPTSTATADLLRFVVYNDRIYWETGVTINASYFEKIKDAKIGKTHYVNMTDVNAFDKEKKEEKKKKKKKREKKEKKKKKKITPVENQKIKLKKTKKKEKKKKKKKD